MLSVSQMCAIFFLVFSVKYKRAHFSEHMKQMIIEL